MRTSIYVSTFLCLLSQFSLAAPIGQTLGRSQFIVLEDAHRELRIKRAAPVALASENICPEMDIRRTAPVAFSPEEIEPDMYLKRSDPVPLAHEDIEPEMDI